LVWFGLILGEKILKKINNLMIIPKVATRKGLRMINQIKTTASVKATTIVITGVQ